MSGKPGHQKLPFLSSCIISEIFISRSDSTVLFSDVGLVPECAVLVSDVDKKTKAAGCGKNLGTPNHGGHTLWIGVLVLPRL